MRLFNVQFNPRRAARTIFWIVVVVLLAQTIYLWRIAPAPIRAATVPATPYTTNLREVARDRHGQETRVMGFTTAVRSDGSTALIVRDRAETFRVLDFSSKVHVEIQELHGLRSVQTTSDAPLHRDPKASCVLNENVLGFETIDGYKAVKLGEDVRRSWYALDHGCALIRESWRFEDGRTTEKTLVSLLAGEPEPTIFQVPTTYREVPPSMIVDPEQKHPDLKQRFATRDRHYFAHRPAVLPK
jgi:hypothetical protein